MSPIARIAAGGRADELDLAALADFREVRVLGEKSVAGMNRIHVADLRRAHDAIDLQITLGAGGRADADRFVRQLHVQRIDIRLRVNRERADAEFLAGADDAERDFAAVGDQDFFEHRVAQAFSLARARHASKEPAQNLRYRTRKSTWPNCTGFPFSATTSAITPLTSALISFITFIASMMQTTVSSFTSLPTSTNGGDSGEAAR